MVTFNGPKPLAMSSASSPEDRVQAPNFTPHHFKPFSSHEHYQQVSCPHGPGALRWPLWLKAGVPVTFVCIFLPVSGDVRVTEAAGKWFLLGGYGGPGGQLHAPL